MIMFDLIFFAQVSLSQVNSTFTVPNILVNVTGISQAVLFSLVFDGVNGCEGFVELGVAFKFDAPPFKHRIAAIVTEDVG